MDWRGYIHSNPRITVGKPVVKGTRLAVEFLLDLYGAGWTKIHHCGFVVQELIKVSSLN